MELIEIAKETCTQCGICAAVCPGMLIRLRTDGYPRPIRGADLGCIRCGHCVAACPTSSLSHREMVIKDCPPLDKTLRITAEQTAHFLKNRRSIRVYREEPVPRDLIEKVIDIARYAPSGHNSQCVEWVVLGKGNELGRIRQIGTDWMRWMIAEQPEMASTLGLKPMLRSMEAGNDPFLRSAPGLIVAHAAADNLFAVAACPIALTYLDLAANGLGLGCCWAGLFNRAAIAFPPMIEALSLPSGHRPFGSMLIGYPKYVYQRTPTRKQPSVTWRI